MNTIMARSILSFGIFFILLVNIFMITVIVTKQQKDDGLVVNMSGRQRMLTQKMTKETLIFSSLAQNVDEKDKQASLHVWKNQLFKTMEVFETTLFALQNGGLAPLNLEMTQFRMTPAATKKEIKAGLKTVMTLWLSFKENIKAVVDSQGQDSKAQAYVIANNVELLTEMNKVVFKMQAEAERKIAFMFYAQLFAVLVGALLVIISIVIVRISIVNPIKNLVKAADSMSTGNLGEVIAPSGMRELKELSKSLDRMRISLKKLMDRWPKRRYGF